MNIKFFVTICTTDSTSVIAFNKESQHILVNMKCEKYHYIISITCRDSQGRRERVRTPVNIPPPSKGGLARGKEGSKAVSVVRKMTAGRKCRQHDKLLPN